MKYRSSLPGLSGQTSSDAIHSISSKNHIISEGLAFGGVALFSTLVEQMKDQDHVKRSREDHLKTETNEAKWKNILRFISKGAGAGALTKAGVAYKSLLAIQYENPDVIDCGADDMRRALALFPLLETPADILTATGVHLFSCQFPLSSELPLTLVLLGRSVDLSVQEVSGKPSRWWLI